jgi:hypothetical protein
VAACVVGAALCAGLTRAHAQGVEPEVVLRVDACLDVPADEVDRLFFLELRTRPVEARARAP